MAIGVDLSPPAGLDDNGADLLENDGGTADAVPGFQVLAAENRRLPPRATRIDAGFVDRLRFAGHERFRRLEPARTAAGRFDVDQRGDKRRTLHDEAELLAVGGLESGAYRTEVAERHFEGAVSALIPDMEDLVAFASSRPTPCAATSVIASATSPEAIASMSTRLSSFNSRSMLTCRPALMSARPMP